MKDYRPRSFEWWFCRIVLFRWLIGCGGNGYTRENDKLHVCNKRGCH